METMAAPLERGGDERVAVEQMLSIADCVSVGGVFDWRVGDWSCRFSAICHHQELWSRRFRLAMAIHSPWWFPLLFKPPF